MSARLFVDALWICRKLVPEPVQVDALPTGDQTLLVGSAEIEVPDLGRAFDGLPVADARQRSVDYSPTCDARGILRGERVAHHVPNVVGNQIAFLDLQIVQHTRDIHGLILLFVSGLRVSGEAHAAQVGNDDRVVLHQLGGEGRPHVAGVAKSMQQHRGGPCPTDSNV